MKLSILTALLGLSLLGSTPASGQKAYYPEATSTAVDVQAPTTKAPITPLDHLSVAVFREPDLSVEDVTVDESGRLAVPLIGTLVAAGKTPETLQAEIATRLRQYVREPQVAVTIKQAASRRLTVTGSVIQPGVYPLEGRMTLLQAVALAKGPSPVASMDQAFIFRVKNGQRSAARFNLDAIAKGKADDPEVISGDTVSLGASGFKTAWRDIIGSIRAFNIFSVIP